MNNDVLYSLRVKNGAGWRKFARIRLMISVGQEYHEGGKLRAVVDWINRNPTIAAVHVSVNDALQRHNYYAAGFDKTQADAIALSEGALWLARNEDVLFGVRNCQLSITRWREWYEGAAYHEARKALDEFARENADFMAEVEKDAAMLAARKTQRGESVPPTLTQHSKNYLLEELAVFAVQTRQLPAAEVYPGSNLRSAAWLVGRSLPEAIAPLAHRYFTRIDFARIAPYARPVATLSATL